MNIFFSILPIALTIALGHAVMRAGIVPRENWAGIEALSFRLLIPAILIRAIATADLSPGRFGPMVGLLIGVLAVMALGLLILRRILPPERLSNPAFTTLFQTTIRWNAFIALAAADQFQGADGLALVAVAMAALIPLINITAIIVLTVYGTARTSTRAVVLMVLRNPLVQACAVGIGLNVSGIGLSGPLLETVDLIGRGALGVGLLAVGAGISLRRMLAVSGRIWLGVALRPVIGPALFWGGSVLLALPADQVLAGTMALAVPCASNGYIVARQMGGDAGLYADVLTWQTVLSLAVLPFLAWSLGAG